MRLAATRAAAYLPLFNGQGHPDDQSSSDRSSALGPASVSNQITGELIDALRQNEPGVEVVTRDVGAHPLPHLAPERMAALSGNTQTPETAETARYLDAVLAEVEAAEVIVIGSPMYNFGITSTLKVWFDHLLRAGKTFRYTANGPEGLLTGKRAIVVEARGGVYTSGPAAPSDHQEPHLRSLLGFVGITDQIFVRAEGLAISPESRAASVEAALDEVRQIAPRFAKVAA